MKYIPHTILLTSAQGEKLAEVAHYFHKSKSALIRDCLEKFLPLLSQMFAARTISGIEAALVSKPEIVEQQEPESAASSVPTLVDILEEVLADPTPLASTEVRAAAAIPTFPDDEPVPETPVRPGS